MAVRSVFLPSPQIQNDRIRIDGDEHRHLQVARAESNEVIEIMNGSGTAWMAQVESVGKRETVVRVTEVRTIPRSSLELILGLAMFRSAAFEFALEKVVEVGVSRILPFVASRSNVSRSDRVERWRRIVIEAAKQAKQYHLPVVESPVSFEQVISIPAETKILFAERDGGSLKSALAGSPVLCLIGPEGGWTDAELSAAHGNRFHPVSLGASILKAETAAIAGTALIRYEFGK